MTDHRVADNPNDVWFRAGLSFECTGCGNCCSGPESGFVWVEDHEILAIATCMNMDHDLERFHQQFVRTIGARKSLVEYSDGDCIFLDPSSRKCSVYHARPQQCRSWPFWKQNLESPSHWGRAAKSCPGCNQGRLYSVDQIVRIQSEGQETQSGPS